MNAIVMTSRGLLSRIGSRCTWQRAYGEWATKAEITTPTNNEGGSITVFGGYADEYDLARPSYPEAFWKDVEAECRVAAAAAAAAAGSCKADDLLGVALDVAAGTGRGALALARMGSWKSVTAVDLDKGMLKQAELNARMRGLDIGTIHASADKLEMVATGSIDLLVCLQAFHWFDAQAALREFHRVLDRETGVLVVAWNDRDLSVPWVRDVETLIETANPLYSRELKQAAHVTSGGQIFPTARFSSAGTEAAAVADSCETDALMRSYPNATPGCTADGLVSLMRTMSYVRNALDDEQRSVFEIGVRAMIADHHGDAPFALPWVTNAYFLRPK